MSEETVAERVVSGETVAEETGNSDKHAPARDTLHHIVVVAKWEGALDEARMHAHLNNETVAEADDPEAVLVEEDLQQEAGGLGPRRAPA